MIIMLFMETKVFLPRSLSVIAGLSPPPLPRIPFLLIFLSFHHLSLPPPFTPCVEDGAHFSHSLSLLPNFTLILIVTEGEITLHYLTPAEMPFSSRYQGLQTERERENIYIYIVCVCVFGVCTSASGSLSPCLNGSTLDN